MWNDQCAVFHTLWKEYFPNLLETWFWGRIFVYCARYFKLWLLAYFFILLNCAKFEKDWTTFISKILQGSPPLMFFVFVIYQKFRWRFHKILRPSQNIWTLKVDILNLSLSNMVVHQNEFLTLNFSSLGICYILVLEIVWKSNIMGQQPCV